MIVSTDYIFICNITNYPYSCSNPNAIILVLTRIALKLVLILMLIWALILILMTTNTMTIGTNTTHMTASILILHMWLQVLILSMCLQVLLQGGVTFRDSAYHRECFTCTKCNTELAHIKFATKDNDPYCPECYIKLFAKICEKCRQPIAGGCQILTGHLLTPVLSYQM